MSNVNEGAIDFTSEAVKVNAGGKKDFEKKPVRRIKLKANQKIRMRFTSGQVVMRLRHFNPIDKKYYRCLAHEGYCPACVAASNKEGQIRRAAETYGANVLVYNADNEGEVIEPLSAEVYFWAFGSDKFVAIRNIIKEWGPITGIDIKVECTDEQFQKVSLTNCSKCYYSASGDSFKMLCDEKIEKDSYPLDKFLCKEVNLVQMVQIFGLPESYIPEDMRHLMGQGQPIAQDMASNQSNTPQPNPQPTPTPAPPKDNFAGLNDIQNLL